MAAGVVAPVLAITAIALANDWYNTGSPNLRIPVAGAIAAATGSLISQAPGLEPVMTAIGWLALIGLLISPVQSPSPLDNLTKIIGGL